MRSLSNIEKSGFHPGEYVGYAQGIWRIKRHDRQWRAVHTKRHWVVCLDTLHALNTYFVIQSKFKDPDNA